MTAVLDNTGVHISVRDFASQKNINGVLNEFTAIHKIMRGHSIETKAYKVREGILNLPRRGAFDLLKAGKLEKIKNKIAPVPKCDKIRYTGKLTANQKTVIRHILKNELSSENIERGAGVCLVKMQAGSGKSYLTMGFIHVFKMKSLVVCPTANLVNQWKEELRKYFPDCKIGSIDGKKHIDGDIVVALINSAVGTKITQEYLNTFGFVAYDETHMLVSEKRRDIFWKTNAHVVLGLSATPHRLDKMDIVSTKQIGPIIDVEQIKNYIKNAVVFKGHVKMLMYSGPPKFTRPLRNQTTGTISAPAMINQFAKDPYRTQMIVQEIIKFHKKNMDVLCLSDRLAHVDLLQAFLKANNIDNSDILVGGATAEHLANIKENAKIILGIYACCGTGLSINRLTALVLLTPRRHGSEQILSRILRLGSDYSIERMVVDVVDVNSALKNQMYERQKVYRHHNFTIEKAEVSFDQFEDIPQSDEEASSDADEDGSSPDTDGEASSKGNEKSEEKNTKSDD